MKYADNILKVFATSVSIVLSTLLSTTVLGHSIPTLSFIIGTSIVLVSTVIYARAPIPASGSPVAPAPTDINNTNESTKPRVDVDYPSSLMQHTETQSYVTNSKPQKLPYTAEDLQVAATQRVLSLDAESCSPRSRSPECSASLLQHKTFIMPEAGLAAEACSSTGRAVAGDPQNLLLTSSQVLRQIA